MDVGSIGSSGAGGTAVLERPAVRGARDFGPELDVLRLAADSHLAGLLPRMRFDLRDMPVVVADIVDGLPASEYRQPGGTLDPEVAAGAGAAIGAWHLGAASAAAKFRSAPDTPPAHPVTGDPLLDLTMEALHREWTPTTVVHGRFGLDNAVVTSAPDGCGGARVVLVGWSLSGSGDPAWDLGCLLADVLADASASGCVVAADPALSATVLGYARSAGTIADDLTLGRRVVLSMVARLVGRSTEANDPGLLGLARSVAAWQPRWTARVERWLG